MCTAVKNYNANFKTVFTPLWPPSTLQMYISTEKIISTIIHVPVCMHLTPFYISCRYMICSTCLYYIFLDQNIFVENHIPSKKENMSRPKRAKVRSICWLLENFPDTNKVGKLLERQLTLMLALHHFSKSFSAKVEKKE